jgi:hypothetical protein
VEDRFEKKLANWIGKMLSYGGRLVLINSVLTSLPMFMLSFFEIPKGVRKFLDFFHSRFFGKVTVIRRSIGSQDGILFVDPRTKVVSGWRF